MTGSRRRCDCRKPRSEFPRQDCRCLGEKGGRDNEKQPDVYLAKWSAPGECRGVARARATGWRASFRCHGAGGRGGPLGPRMEILGFGEMHPGKVVTGAPYSAVTITETRQTLADGNTISRKVQANVFRDGQGRTRRETTLTGVGPLAATGASRTFVRIYDPVAGTAFVLHQDTKVAEKLPMPRGGRKGPGNLQGRFEARMQTE